MSTAPFYGVQDETNTATQIDTINQQVSLEDQGLLARVYDKAQRIVTMPVDYVFGEKDSYAKKTFYVFVGGAILAVSGYSLYRHFYGNVITPVKESQVKDDQERAERKVENLDEEARIAQQTKMDARIKADLKLYESIVANRMNAQAEYKAMELKLQQLEHNWNTDRKYRYANYTDSYGRNPYHDAEIAYHKERVELSSKITDLGKRWSNCTVQEVQFERDHQYIPQEQFKEVEQLQLGRFHRWGRAVIV
jgi:hypothetical protein